MPDENKMDYAVLDRVMRVAELTDEQRQDIHSHIRGLMPNTAEDETYPYPENGPGWVCFHCGQRFLTVRGARLHFGLTPKTTPMCQKEDE